MKKNVENYTHGDIRNENSKIDRTALNWIGVRKNLSSPCWTSEIARVFQIIEVYIKFYEIFESYYPYLV